MEERVVQLEGCIRGGTTAEELSNANLAQRTAQLAQQVAALEAKLGTPYQQHRKLVVQVQPLLCAYGAEESDGEGGARQDGLSQAAKRELLLDAPPTVALPRALLVMLFTTEEVAPGVD